MISDALSSPFAASATLDKIIELSVSFDCPATVKPQ